jgi:HAE1 family hydrophobic/amphiphilic exporter-1
MVMAKFKHERKRGEDEIKDAIRKEIPEFEGGKIEFTEGMGTTGGGGGEGAPIEIKIFGPDLGTLDRLSLEIMEQIKDVSGIRDIDRSIGEGKPELRIRIDRDKTSQIGLPVALVAKQVEGAMKGNLATRYREKGEEIDVRVGFREEDKEKLSDIENISIATPMGVNLPLKSIARIEKQKGPVQLLRKNRKRHVSVTAGFSGRDLGSVMADIRDRVKTIGMPEDYFVDYGGEAERMYDMFRDLGVVFILAILIVYMIMAATFESLVHPLVVMFTLPFAVVGVILALLLTGKTISLVSGLGAIILVGVIVNNGIVLIDYVNRLRGEGLSKDEALIQGGVTKLRAIVLITLTAILGLLPMAVRTTRFGAMMAPMAITVIGGLLVGTILTLIIIPVVYSVIDEFAEKTRMRARRIIHGE